MTRNNHLITRFSFSLISALFVLLVSVATIQAGATLTVDTSADNTECDGDLTLREALLVANSQFDNPAAPAGRLGRPLTEGERIRITGVAGWAAVPGCGATVGYLPVNNQSNGVGSYHSDNIRFTNDVSVIYVWSYFGNNQPVQLVIGQNDHIDGRKPNGEKVVLDGFNAGQVSGLVDGGNSDDEHIRNLEIRNFALHGISGKFDKAVFEGLIIHHNGGNGIYLHGVQFFGVSNPYDNRIGNAADQTTRNFIYSNGQDGINISAFPNDPRPTPHNNIIENTYIGYRNSSVNTDDGNGRNGIFLQNTFGNRIGGETTDNRNYIGGNNNDGIFITGEQSYNNRIINNIIGKLNAGTATGDGIGNGQSGVAIFNGAGDIGKANRVGEPGKFNIIAGNGNAGVYISGNGTNGNVVQDNFIGTSSAANTDIGNANYGIFIGGGARDNLIGGDTSSDDNVIAFNDDFGIYHQGGIGNVFRRNRIFANTELGIDLAPTGVTPNDNGDGDASANNLLNYPVLSRLSGTNTLTISGSFSSSPNKTVTIDFYGNDSCDNSGHGEGRYYLGNTTVSTDSTGSVNFNPTFAVSLSTARDFVTATATNAQDGTSEFSKCLAVGCTYSLSATSITIPATGDSRSFNVTTSNASYCPWIAVASHDWIRILQGSGNGSGTITFSVAENNTGTTRTGTITVNGETIMLTQPPAPACSYTLSPTSRTVPATGGTFSFSIATAANCQWTATDSVSWITTSGSGTGNGTVNFTVAANTGAERTATISVGNQTFTVRQEDGCTYNISPTSVTIPASSATGRSFSVTTGAGCAWTATTIEPWITITGGSGTGNGTVTFNVAANTGEARTGKIEIDNRAFFVNQEAACVFSLIPTIANVSGGGGAGSFDVNASGPCGTWMATSNANWITINTVGGNGSGTINYTVAPNTGAARTGTITAAGLTFRVNQAAACSFTVSPTSAGYGSNGGNGIINVSTPDSGCQRTAVSNVNWITITSGASGTGSGAVGYSVQANNTGQQRTGTITVAGRTVTITQAAIICSYSINPINVNIPASGDTRQFSVTAQTGCAWTAVSNVPWITTNSAGNGNGTVNYTVQPNTGAGRTGTITVGGQTFTVIQAAGCSYNLSPTSASHQAAGGNGSFSVTAQAGCAWTAVSDAVWITVTAGSSGNGNGAVNYSVAVNNTGQQRSGTITVAGQVFNITQAFNCGYTLSPPSFNLTAANGNHQVNLVTNSTGCVWSATSNAPWITILSNGGTGNAVINFAVSANTGALRTGTITIAIAGNNPTTVNVVQAAAQNANRTRFDFDGDGRADFALLRPSNSIWYIRSSSAGGFYGFQFHAPGDRLAPADYDGDGRTDVAVFRPSNGYWYLQRSTAGFTAAHWGISGDIPAPADYDGDGRADLAVFRPSNGYWYIMRSRDGFTSVHFGSNGDVPVPGDYDNDGKTDVAVFRPTNGAWYILGTSTGFSGVLWGLPSDKPVIGDFDGDGRADQAVFRPSNGYWYINGSATGFRAVNFGLPTDIPVAADFDGDRRTDIAVFRPSGGTWYVLRSTQGFYGEHFGANGDLPAQAAFVP